MADTGCEYWNSSKNQFHDADHHARLIADVGLKVSKERACDVLSVLVKTGKPGEVSEVVSVASNL